MFKPRIILIFLASVVFITNLPAQPEITVFQALSYHSNAFYNYKQLADFTNYTGIGLKHYFNGEKIQSRIFYNGDLNAFKTYSERFYHQHHFGYDGLAANAANTQTLYFGLSYSRNDFQANYNFYDSWKVEGYLNSRIEFLPNLIGRFGYTLTHKKYVDLPEFSYQEHDFYLQGNTFFQSGTSIALLINYGLKNYIPLPISPGRRGRNVAQYSDLPGVDQLVTSIKIAQSLGTKTALSLKYLNRTNPGLVAGAAAVATEGELFTENELFDDRYGYQGHEFNLTFTHYLPFYIKMETNASLQLKNYLNRQIYNLDGDLTLTNADRSDKRRIFWGRVSRGVGAKWGLKNLELYLDAGYIQNASNDPYYQFDNIFGSLGMNLRVR